MLVQAILYLGACLGIILAVQQLWEAERGLQHLRAQVGQVPVEVLLPAEPEGPRPVVVIAHGFSSSKQMMSPFAYTLARHGYVAATLDWSGHGRNPGPFPYDWSAVHAGDSALTRELEAVLAYVQSLPEVRGEQVALVGHSMGSAIVTRYARDHGEIAATIAVSAIFSDVLPAQPRNLLLLTGALELPRLQAAARAALAASGGGSEGETAGALAAGALAAGSLAAGDARRLVFVPYADHATVVLSPRALRETVQWLDGTFGRASEGAVDTRAVWVGLLAACALVLFWPVSRWLLQGWVERPGPCPLELVGVLLVLVIPAAAAPLLLRWLPYHLLPLAAGDYMVSLLALQGLLMLGLLAVTGCLDAPILGRFFSGRAWLAAGLLAACLVLAVGWALDRTLLSAWPTPQRAIVIGAAFLLVAPYFVCADYVTRAGSRGLNRILPLLAKAMLLGSLAWGASTSGGSSGVLVLFLPGLALLLAVGQLLSRRIYVLTGEPVVSGLFMALIFAWLTGSVFPLT